MAVYIVFRYADIINQAIIDLVRRYEFHIISPLYLFGGRQN